MDTFRQAVRRQILNYADEVALLVMLLGLGWLSREVCETMEGSRTTARMSGPRRARCSSEAGRTCGNQRHKHVDRKFTHVVLTSCRGRSSKAS